MDIKNTVIITVLMSLSDNSNICAFLSQFLFVDFSSHYEFYSPIPMHGNFLIGCIVNFTLLNAGYFCILIILNSFLGAVKFLGISLIFFKVSL